MENNIPPVPRDKENVCMYEFCCGLGEKVIRMEQ